MGRGGVGGGAGRGGFRWSDFELAARCRRN